MTTIKSTNKQEKARTRNWHIRCLRAYYHNCSVQDHDTKLAVKALIDKELERLGAESETARVVKREEELMKELG